MAYRYGNGVAGRLLTAIAAVAATAAMTLLAPSASVAGAAEQEAGLCTPTMGSMGESDSSINATDTGVATYVGGDMLIGQRTDDDTMQDNNGGKGGGPKGSYAAEIEGATIVNGNLYAKPKKGFFTAGIVAFGSQFVPAAGTAMLLASRGRRAAPAARHASDTAP